MKDTCKEKRGLVRGGGRNIGDHVPLMVRSNGSKGFIVEAGEFVCVAVVIFFTTLFIQSPITEIRFFILAT